MTDNQDYLGMARDPKLKLKADVLMLQLKGAGYAAIFCLVAVFAIWFLYGVGLLLPEESRETEDPTPFSYNLIVEDTAQV
jgi:hypothetical protein